MTRRILVAAVLVAGCLAGPALAQSPVGDRQASITDRSVAWPTAAQWRRAVLLQDYNTRIVVFGTTTLGLAGGVIGGFALLRKRALMGDALSHATLPGIGAAFLVVSLAGGNGKSLPVLLAGAAASGLLGVATILLIRRFTRIKEDAALGIVLSVFFGAGVAALGLAQQTQTGSAAGLEGFIYGKTASMSANDARLIAAAGLASAAIAGLLFKELKLLCFDEAFAAASGQPVGLLDAVLMALIVAITIVGLQAVGLILMISLLVTPAAAARFWTGRMAPLTAIAAGIGAVSGAGGAIASALFPRLPSGAMIVLAAAGCFGVSMAAGVERGVVVRWLRRRNLNRRVERQHLLRAAFELVELKSGAATADAGDRPAIDFADLVPLRSWSPRRLRRAIDRAERDGLLLIESADRLRLTRSGTAEAERLAHEHRLWELYLITYAEVAPGKVDRDADAIEHVLAPELIAELEALLQQRHAVDGVAASPHPIASEASPSSRSSRRAGDA